ncbi:MAG: hypothetical protein RLZZ323_1056, partial [Bacteroidota bacterium]
IEISIAPALGIAAKSPQQGEALRNREDL